MARIRFVQRDGSEKFVNVGSDASIMLAAVRNGIHGIDGECGGCLGCSISRVYVDDIQAPLVPPPSDEELDLLSAVSGVQKPNSRLTCQLKVTARIDEPVVYVPEIQS